MDADTIHWPTGVPSSRRSEKQSRQDDTDAKEAPEQSINEEGKRPHRDSAVATSPDSIQSDDAFNFPTPTEPRSDSQPGTPAEDFRLPDKTCQVRSTSFGAARRSPAPFRTGICVDTVERPTLVKSNTFTAPLRTSMTIDQDEDKRNGLPESPVDQRMPPIRQRVERRATAAPMPVTAQVEGHRQEASRKTNGDPFVSKDAAEQVDEDGKTHNDTTVQSEAEPNIGAQDWQTKASDLDAFAAVMAARSMQSLDVDETNPTSFLDKERNQLITHFWNQGEWELAEKYLISHLDSLNARSEAPSVRRVQHLLAVCSSLAGKWHQAVHRFIQVLRKPITVVSNLDDGDCAAAYWLGDLYAMQDRRIDALLAYAIAERAPRIQSDRPAQQVIRAEQAALQTGLSKSEIEQGLCPEPGNDSMFDSPSILDSAIITLEVAKPLLDNTHAKSPDTLPMHTDRARSCYLTNAHARTSPPRSKPDQNPHTVTLDSTTFTPTAPWPLPHDPLLCVPNILHGHTLASTSISSPPSNDEQYLYTSPDIPTLLHHLCDCLREHDIEISQVVSKDGMTCFCVRESYDLAGGMANLRFFRVVVGEMEGREGWGGVRVEPEGMCSARVVNGEDEQTTDLNGIESKIRAYLEDALGADEKHRQEHDSGNEG